MAVGSEAIDSSTEVYRYVKAAVKKMPGLKPVAEQLGARFIKSRRVKDKSDEKKA